MRIDLYKMEDFAIRVISGGILEGLYISTLHAILHGINDAWRRCELVGNNQPQEPDLVASIVTETSQRLYSAWSKLFNEIGIDLSICSVYCHQTPKVTFSGMRRSSCELGDLLFIRRHVGHRHNYYQHALLYQVKASSSQPYKIKSSDSDQLELYLKWPEFTYCQSGPLNGQIRNIEPKKSHTGAEYLIIDNRSFDEPESGLLGLPGTYPAGACMPDEYLNPTKNLVDEMMKLLFMQNGRNFESINSYEYKLNGWTTMIWDLLGVSLNSAFNRKLSGRINTPRFMGDMSDIANEICFAKNSGRSIPTLARSAIGFKRASYLYSDNVTPPNNDEERSQPGGLPIGISVIIVETQTKKGGLS